MKKAVLLNDTSHDHHYGCEVVMRNIHRALRERGIEVIYACPVGHDWKADSLCLSAIQSCDIVVVNGEGTIHHSKMRGKWLVEVAPHAEALGKPAVLFNATYQENDESFVPYLKAFKHIYVRESLSQAELQAQGVKSEVVPDMTFYSSYQENGSVAESPRIGFSDGASSRIARRLYKLSIACRHSPYLPMFTPVSHECCDMRSFYKQAIFYLQRFLGKVVARFMRVKMRYISYAHVIPTFDAYVAAIKGLNLLVTGRFHSLCFAIQNLVPFVALSSNSHKIEGLITDMGIGQGRILPIDVLEKCSPDEMLERFGRYTEEEKEKIRKYNREAVLKIDAMFDEIAALANTE